MPINDRVVIITGPGGSLGPTVCKVFADAGASLVLVGREQDTLDEVVQTLGLPEARLLAQTANLTDAAEVGALAKAVKEKFGRADVVLHLVGGYKAGATVVDLNPDDVTSMLDQHLWSTLHVSRAFVPLMTEAGWGRLAVITTPLAQNPTAKSTPYTVGKAAQETLMMTLAQELKGSGVTANCIQVKSIEKGAPDPAKPRTGSAPSEIAAALLWLCSDEAGATNGARIPVFGRA
jgi:NAD(P)-dependent dehydrogenase (short-subunit alcohol dehydrogenase family)